MKTVKVSIDILPIIFNGDRLNYTVSPDEYDLGDPIGHGATQAKALLDFIESWMLRYDEEITVEITRI